MSEELQNKGFEETIQNETADGEDSPSESVSEENISTEESENESYIGPENNDSEVDDEIHDEHSGSPLFGGKSEHYYRRPFVPYGFNSKTYREKREISRLALGTCLPAISLHFFGQYWFVIYIFIMRAIGLSDLQIYNSVQNPAILEALQIAISLIMFLVPFTIAAKAMDFRIDDLVPFGKPKKGTALPLFFAGFGFCILANIFSNYAGAFFRMFGFTYDVPENEIPGGIFGFLLFFISTSLVPGLVEEFGCRGILFGMLKKYGDGFAIITSAAIFGLIHGNFEQMFFAFMVGLVLGVVRVKSGSIWVCVLIHSANNFISVALSFLNVEAIVKNMILILVFCLALLLGILGMAFSGNDNMLPLAKPQHSCSVAQKYKWFMVSPAFIVMAALFVYESLTFFS